MEDEIDLSHVPSRHEEGEYFDAHREEWSRAHPREWVAIVGHEIVAIGPDAVAVFRRARELGHENPFVGGLMDPEFIGVPFIGPQ